MIYPFDFIQLMDKRDYAFADKQVMARVALNVLIDPQQFPVDLSEIGKLDNEPRVLTHALLAYMSQHTEEYGTWGSSRCDTCFKVLQAKNAQNKSKSRKRKQ